MEMTHPMERIASLGTIREMAGVAAWKLLQGSKQLRQQLQPWLQIQKTLKKQRKPKSWRQMPE
jgi:hypothetical protein